MNWDAPLAGVKVLDAGDFLAAPFCAMTLGDWGAEVIKVESLAGDTARRLGEMVSEPDVSAIFVSGNRGKRSLALDIRANEGIEVLRRIALSCDIVVHNRTAEQAKEFGLDHAMLAAERPDIIVGSVTAFGDTGPYAGRGALDPIAQAMSGMMAATGPVEGEPTRAAVTVVDFGAGMTLAAGVLAALHRRSRTGIGGAVTTALLDVGMLYSSSLYPHASVTGQPPPRLGNRSLPVLADQFATKDGFVVIAIWDEQRWRLLCDLLGLVELGVDPGLQSNADRLAAYDLIGPALHRATAGWTTTELVSELEVTGIACAQTLDVRQAAENPHIKQSGALYEEDRLESNVQMVSGVLRVDDQRATGPLPPPRLGEHSREVLSSVLGAGEDEIARLIDRGIVREPVRGLRPA